VPREICFVNFNFTIIFLKNMHHWLGYPVLRSAHGNKTTSNQDAHASSQNNQGAEDVEL
jgi:hypothetical protein